MGDVFRLYLSIGLRISICIRIRSYRGTSHSGSSIGVVGHCTPHKGLRSFTCRSHWRGVGNLDLDRAELVFVRHCAALGCNRAANRVSSFVFNKQPPICGGSGSVSSLPDRVIITRFA